MTSASLAPAGNANSRVAQLGTRKRTIGSSIDAIRSKAKALWGNKTAAELALRTGLSLHTTKKILSGKRGMGLDAFTALMESAEGIAFFGAVVDAMPKAAKVRWEREFERAARRAELFARQAAVEREIERELLAEEQPELGLSRHR